MKKDLLATAFLLLTLVVIAVGCEAGSKPSSDGAAKAEVAPTTPGTLAGMATKGFMAASNALTVENMSELASGGAGLMIIGALVAAIGMTKRGATLFAGGGAMVIIFNNLSENPWMINSVLLVAVVAFGAWLYDKRKSNAKLDATEDALKEAVTVIQPHSDLKRDMCGGDIVKQEAIRPIIDAIKTGLKLERKI